MQSNIWTSSRQYTHLTRNNTLLQNYPNPFQSVTMISYLLPITGDLELSIYDLSGRKLTTLLNETQLEGQHEIEWNASGVQPGIYFAELSTAQGKQVIKMILIE